MNKTQTHPGDKASQCPRTEQYHSPKHLTDGAIQLRENPRWHTHSHLKATSQIFLSSVDGATIHPDAQAKN